MATTPPVHKGNLAGAVESIQKKKTEAEEERRRLKEQRLAEFLGTAAPSDAAAEQQVGENGSVMKTPMKRGSLLGRWGEAISLHQSVEKSKLDEERGKTIKGFRTTDGTGIVRKMVGEWEEVFMQMQATTSQIKATIAAGAALRSAQIACNPTTGESAPQSEEISENFVINASPDPFPSGHTAIYTDATLGKKSHSRIKTVMGTTGGKPCVMQCGVYGATSQPPIEIVAVAISTGMDTSYLALTITVCEGYEFDESAYGLKKVAIFLPGEKESIFERLVEIIPKQGWEDWRRELEEARKEAEDEAGNETNFVRRRSGSYGSNNTSSKKSVSFSPQVLESSSAEAASKECDTSQQISESPPSQPFIERISFASTADRPSSVSGMSLDDYLIKRDSAKLSSSGPDHAPAQSSESETSSTLPPPPPQIQPQTSTNTTAAALTAAAAAAAASANKQQQQEIHQAQAAIYDSDEEDDRGSISAAAATAANTVSNSGNDHTDIVTGMNVFTFSDTIITPTCRSEAQFIQPRGDDATFNNPAWTLEDERMVDLPAASQEMLKISAMNIESVSCSSNCLVLQTPDNTIICTGTLKSVTTNSNCVVTGTTGDIIFEWVRGAAMSGFMQKWPMKSQRSGRMTRRFFILRDNLLSYHKRKPLNEAAAEAGFYLSCVQLTPETTVARSRHYLIPCITVTTPNDTLWVRCGSSEKEKDMWISQMRAGIAQLSRNELFRSKTRVETVWHHECKNFRCISVDAAELSDRYVHAGLYQMDNTVQQKTNTVSTSSTSSIASSITSTLSSTNTTTTTTTSDGGRQSAFVRPPLPVDTSLFTHSVDISTNGVERKQYEVVYVNSFQGILSHDLGSKLCCVKVFNDTLVMSGSHGVIGLGHVCGEKMVFVPACPTSRSKNSKSVDVQAPRGSSISAPAASVATAAAATTAVPADPAAPLLSPESGIDKVEEAHINDEDNDNDDEEKEEQLWRSRAGHDKSSTVTCLAVSHKTGLLIGGDDQGCLSLWRIGERIKESTDTQANSNGNGNGNGNVEEDKKLTNNLAALGLSDYPKLNLLRFLDVADLDSYAGKITRREERIRTISIHSPSASSSFASAMEPNEDMVLVSTNERLLLIFVQNEVAAPRDVTKSPNPKGGYKNFTNTMSGARFTRWVELDRVLPGCEALFSLYISDDNAHNMYKSAPSSSNSSSGGGSGGNPPSTDTTVVLWKLVGTEELDPSSLRDHHRFSTVFQSMVFRLDWTVDFHSMIKREHQKNIDDELCKKHLLIN